MATKVSPKERREEDMPMTEDIEAFIEERRDDEVDMFYDLKTQGVRICRIITYIALKKKISVETVRRDLRLRGIIGEEAIKKIERMDRKDRRTKSKKK